MDEDLGWNNVEAKENRRKRSKKKKTVNKQNAVEYLLNNYKIRMCRKREKEEGHDIRTCMNAHNQGELRRFPYRDDQTIRYSKNMCNNMLSKSYCNHGDECLESHNEAEQHFHPAIYKTVLCNRSPCHIFFCYFAHGQNELRTLVSKHFDVKKERSVQLCDFIEIPGQKGSEDRCGVEEIEVIRDWTGWQQRIASSELLPHPLKDVYSRMIHKYPEIQSKLREICLTKGCTPYMEVGQRSSNSPIMLMLSAPTRDDIFKASSEIDKYLAKCRPRTEDKFPARFLSYLRNCLLYTSPSPRDS